MEEIPKISSAEEKLVVQRVTTTGLEKIRKILTHYKIQKAALFGSILRKDFEPGRSDLDLLMMFPQGTTYISIAAIKRELEEQLGMKVDVASWNGVASDKNPLRREEIFSGARRIYDQAA